ncbi:hypothetical protein KQ939_16420 [Planococcus sp. CP5-4]|uniref:hypothetical protein n=1 Tax=unclassified Planococcus (in: firmicutes) TaxID=2662419 RepID=UPI001C229F0F|nr:MULTISPECIES: hypothetical protein [unclassified Planococcus (in: firmicutes)]MBU9673908.1 hypothetical protein [Planococcus sp. CP5-4_YE]MBV0909778.1 hypothetical protein [Planococcus sp. CP5-4_UN]MBW6065262.1 hypothetical protein [Planococcus sp. CP5-4]
MTAIVKEEMTMEIPKKTYLQTYKEHIDGYKKYKLEKLAPQWHVPVGSKVKKIQG